MSEGLSSLPARLARAWAHPAVQADGAACPLGLHLAWDAGSGVAAGQVTLWPGVPGAAQLTCRAQPGVWQQVLSAVPPVGCQSFGALRRRPEVFRVEGSELSWVQALPFLERLLETLRFEGNAPGATAAHASARASDHGAPTHGTEPPAHLRALKHIQGRYVQLGTQPNTWVYSESCGNPQAPPLLMLHTAGSDTRQWHGLMAQAALRQDWHLLGFDMPGHGRSPLPQDEPNWTWRLNENRYIDCVLNYLDALQLDRVSLMGCSMGAAISLALLAKHPDRFHGALLLEAPYHSPGRRSPYLHHAQVHGARLSAAWVGALLSPTSPAAGRDYATWIYSQGAPGVYDGDLAFYSDEYNAHTHTPHIDTTRTPLWLFTGDYDYSATPADSARIAQEIAGAHFETLAGFGHFPMVENPDGLLPWIQPALSTLLHHITS
jgi:pimeloyl-ACP methyl ester carboxylesterase